MKFGKGRAWKGIIYGFIIFWSKGFIGFWDDVGVEVKSSWRDLCRKRGECSRGEVIKKGFSRSV